MEDDSYNQFYRDDTESLLTELKAGGDVEKTMQRKQDLVAFLRTGPVAEIASIVNEEIYEKPTEFYQIFLGKHMSYSTCLFQTGEETNDEAEEAMLHLICQRSRLENGMKVLDLGCGWGSSAFWILDKYDECHVTCVSNSRSQIAFIETLAKDKGVTERLKCITADVNDFDTTERFDRVISIEMFEYITNFELIMTKIATWLKNDGLFFTQTTGHREFPHISRTSVKEKAIEKPFEIFEVSISSDLLLYFQKDLLVLGVWNLSGRHYANTARAWLTKINENKDVVQKILVDFYGSNNSSSHFLKWKMEFTCIEEMFAYNEGNEWVISHQLFKKR